MRFKPNHLSRRSKRRQSNLRKNAKRRARRLLFEPLETRLLLAVDFIAYNDHATGPLTHENATTFGDQPGGTNSGFLKDIASGQETGVTLTTTSTGISFQTGSINPAYGTDAANIFAGFVDFTNGNPHSLEAVASQGDSYSHAFSDLDPLSTYDFAGTAIRGNNNYANRWTLVTLVGADSFNSSHSSGVGVVTAGLDSNQVAIWTGANQNASQGYVAQWTEIDPGADSNFQVISTQYRGPTPGVGSGDSSGGGKGYALNGIRLIQNRAIFAPEVINTTANDIEAFTATIGGDVTNTGGETPTATLYWGGSDEGTTPGNWDNSINLGSQSGEFSSAISGLVAESTYFFRSYAQNTAGGTWASSSESFTTRTLTVPGIENTAATQIEAFSAVLEGNVTDTGGDPPAVTVFWGDDDAGTGDNWDSSINLGTHPGAFNAFVGGLQENTTYYFRAQATNVAGTSWAPATESFTTRAISLPAVINNAASNVESFSAHIGGEVTDTGGDAPLVTLYYGDDDGGTDKSGWDAGIDLGSIFGIFGETLTNLTADTSYYFRAHAANAAGGIWATPTFTFQTPEAPLLQISELMASNDATLQTRVRQFPGGGLGPTLMPDWIEVRNLTDRPVDLNGFYLTDDRAVPLKWGFPAGTTIAANGFLVVMASDENVTDPVLDEFGYLHTNFKLTTGGEYLAIHIDDGAASTVHAYDPAYPGQITDISYGIGDDELPHFYAEPTPGLANTGVLNFVDDTKFSVDRGFYDAPFDLAITSDTVDAEIYYTLNGDEPTNVPSATNFLYSGTVHVDKTTTLRAKAFKAGFEPTNSDTHTYIFLDDVVQQTYQSTLEAGFPASWDGTSPDYGLDPDVIGPNDRYDGVYAASIKDDLQALPTLSLVTNVDDVFGDNGIYSHPTNHDLETATSLELINPDGTQGFQVN
ncbi:MAG: chitobiase/beta-hexosaminidase C-terminal domain-containing protein, partial [Pirellulales bacterium]